MSKAQEVLDVLGETAYTVTHKGTQVKITNLEKAKKAPGDKDVGDQIADVLYKCLDQITKMREVPKLTSIELTL